MTPMYFKNLIVLFLVFALNQNSFAQEMVSKTIQKTVNTEIDGTFYINNKYGNIEINGWDESTAKITTTISVFNKKESEATALLERIQSEIKIIDNLIYVESKILEKKANLFSKYLDKANPLKLDKNNIQIDYKINLPKNISLDITNKFGDVIIDSFDGQLKTELQHGDMWINTDIQNAHLNLKFGKLKAKEISIAYIELKNAELNLYASDEMNLISNGSAIDIDQSLNLEISSNKDIVNIREVENIKIDSKFSEITIDQLHLTADATAKVTTFSIAEITTINPTIIIDQESSDIDINISNTNFHFRAQLTEGVLKIPKTFNNIKSKMIDKNKKTREVKAEYGSKSKGKIILNGYKGSILFKESS